MSDDSDGETPTSAGGYALGFGAIGLLLMIGAGVFVMTRPPPDASDHNDRAIAAMDEPQSPSSGLASTSLDSLSRPVSFDARSSVVGPGYVGPQRCVACHAERVAEFSQTNHYRTCRLATPDCSNCRSAGCILRTRSGPQRWIDSEPDTLDARRRRGVWNVTSRGRNMNRVRPVRMIGLTSSQG